MHVTFEWERGRKEGRRGGRRRTWIRPSSHRGRRRRRAAALARALSKPQHGRLGRRRSLATCLSDRQRRMGMSHNSKHIKAGGMEQQGWRACCLGGREAAISIHCLHAPGCHLLPEHLYCHLNGHITPSHLLLYSLHIYTLPPLSVSLHASPPMAMATSGCRRIGGHTSGRLRAIS